MRRGPFTVIVGIAAGIVLVLGVTALGEDRQAARAAAYAAADMIAFDGAQLRRDIAA